MPKNVDGKTYVCDKCGGTFELDLSGEPEKEAEGLWGQTPDKDDMAIICDDCFNKFMQRFN